MTSATISIKGGLSHDLSYSAAITKKLSNFLNVSLLNYYYFLWYFVVKLLVKCVVVGVIFVRF